MCSLYPLKLNILNTVTTVAASAIAVLVHLDITFLISFLFIYITYITKFYMHMTMSIEYNKY